MCTDREINNAKKQKNIFFACMNINAKAIKLIASAQRDWINSELKYTKEKYNEKDNSLLLLSLVKKKTFIYMLTSDNINIKTYGLSKNALKAEFAYV